MKNLILVIGRSGSGKDTLVRAAQQLFGAAAIPSYTDRPMRPTETDGVEHTFLTEDGFTEIMEKERVFAYTKIGETGYRYCTTVEMLNSIGSETLFYVIDPSGYDFCKPYSGEFNLKVIYVTASTEIRKERANLRNGDDSTWATRCEQEDSQFTDFETRKPWDAIIVNNGALEEAQKEFNESVSRFISEGKDG